MQICIYDNADQVGKAAAMLLGAQIIAKPDCVLGLATGSSPVPAYRGLIEMAQAGVVDFSRVTSFNLDEYVGIPTDHVCSYHRFMKDQLFDHVNMRPEAAHVPDGLAEDLEAEGRSYDAAIEAVGGIDLQLLGIGRNGHIGFNEPSDRFVHPCHVVELTESTIEANTRFFHSREEVPKKAISLGIGSIMKAKRIVLIATGGDKADVIAQAVHGDITPRVQASVLQAHPDVIFLLDRAAASKL